MNNENKAKKRKKEKKKKAYMLGDLRNKVRSVETERLFPSADSSCVGAQSKLFFSRGKENRNAFDPKM